MKFSINLNLIFIKCEILFLTNLINFMKIDKTLINFNTIFFAYKF